MLTVIRWFLLVVGVISGLIGMGWLLLVFVALGDTLPKAGDATEQGMTLLASGVLAAGAWPSLILSGICLSGAGMIEAVLSVGRQINKSLIYSRPVRREPDMIDPPVITTAPQPQQTRKHMNPITRLIG